MMVLTLADNHLSASQIAGKLVSGDDSKISKVIDY